MNNKIKKYLGFSLFAAAIAFGSPAMAADEGGVATGNITEINSIQSGLATSVSVFAAIAIGSMGTRLGIKTVNRITAKA